ncbi:MAG: hypothetical protein GXO00_00085 [Candidatus Diapherotrites archaeon]|nr:hypothetical protein [Candidatus Diapherotrites archaeon]
MKGLYPSVKGVVLDTNMLFVPYQFGVDVLEEIQRILPGVKVYTIPQVLREIERLEQEGSLKERLAARVARKILERVEVLPVEGEVSADRALLELAKLGYAIATNDRELRKKIRELGGYSLYLRERSHLEFG